MANAHATHADLGFLSCCALKLATARVCARGRDGTRIGARRQRTGWDAGRGRESDASERTRRRGGGTHPRADLTHALAAVVENRQGFHRALLFRLALALLSFLRGADRQRMEDGEGRDDGVGTARIDRLSLARREGTATRRRAPRPSPSASRGRARPPRLPPPPASSSSTSGLGLMYPPPGFVPWLLRVLRDHRARRSDADDAKRPRSTRPAMVSGSRKSNAKGRGRVINRRPNMGCGASSKPAASGPKVMVVSQPQPQVRNVWWTRRAVAREARSSDPASPRTSR